MSEDHTQNLPPIAAPQERSPGGEPLGDAPAPAGDEADRVDGTTVTRAALSVQPAGAPTRRDAVRARLPRLEVDVRGAAKTLAEAAARAGDMVLDRALTTPERVSSAAEGRALLASDEHPEVAADRLQRTVLAAIPVIRVVGRGARFARIPPVIVVSTALSSAVTIRRGLRELQVIGALVEDRIEQATGAPVDAALASGLATALYLEPKRVPQPAARRRRVGRIACRLALRGAFGRDTGRSALRALDSAEQLDGAAQAALWANRPQTRPPSEP